jgi:hypothetical protein
MRQRRPTARASRAGSGWEAAEVSDQGDGGALDGGSADLGGGFEAEQPSGMDRMLEAMESLKNDVTSRFESFEQRLEPEEEPEPIDELDFGDFPPGEDFELTDEGALEALERLAE